MDTCLEVEELLGQKTQKPTRAEYIEESRVSPVMQMDLAQELSLSKPVF